MAVLVMRKKKRFPHAAHLYETRVCHRRPSRFFHRFFFVLEERMSELSGLPFWAAAGRRHLRRMQRMPLV